MSMSEQLHGVNMKGHNKFGNPGPLAQFESEFAIIKISLSVPLESAFVADELKCFMYKLNVPLQPTHLCKCYLKLITLKLNSCMCSINVNFKILSG